MAKTYHPPHLKQRAKLLRGEGLSFKEIAHNLGIVKSTARLWTKDIPLTPEQRGRLYTKGIEALRQSPNNSRERRLREVAKIESAARKEIREQPISLQTLRLLGAMLYWAEGDKRRNFSVSNSDPLLVKFMVQWMKAIFNIESTQLKAHLNIYPQQDDYSIKRFWSDLTGIPLENFGKTFVKPLSKRYKRNTLYYGTIKIRMRKGGDALRRVFGWIKTLLQDLQIEVDSIETRWNKLKDFNLHP